MTFDFVCNVTATNATITAMMMTTTERATVMVKWKWSLSFYRSIVSFISHLAFVFISFLFFIECVLFSLLLGFFLSSWQTNANLNRRLFVFVSITCYRWFFVSFLLTLTLSRSHHFTLVCLPIYLLGLLSRTIRRWYDSKHGNITFSFET